MSGAKVLHVRSASIKIVIIRNLVNSTRYRGRSLSCELEYLGLPNGARLEPTRALPDVYRLEECELPIDLVFWVGSPDGRVLHNSPLFSIPGITVRSWCVDLLHAWVLGPLAKMIGLSLHLFLLTGLFTPSSNYLTAENKKRLALLHLKTKLKEHYARVQGDDPTWNRKHSEVLSRD